VKLRFAWPLARLLTALVVRDGVLLAGVGLVLGLIGAYFVGRAMQSILFGVVAEDFSVLACVAAILIGAAVLACFLPAKRAARLEPMPVLRAE
jgi:putative ABC transport system permease protein